jgi:hypothetical protein
MRRAAAASETVRSKLPLIGLPVKESFSVGAGSHTTSLFSSTPPRASTTYGGRAGQYSIRVNDQWGICFTWSASGAGNVELIDYH